MYLDPLYWLLTGARGPLRAAEVPFGMGAKLGFIGGTDNHNGAPSDVVEDNYIGSHGPADGTLEARRSGEIDGWDHVRRGSQQPGITE